MRRPERAFSINISADNNWIKKRTVLQYFMPSARFGGTMIVTTWKAIYRTQKGVIQAHPNFAHEKFYIVSDTHSQYAHLVLLRF